MKLVLGRQNPTYAVSAVQLRADATYAKASVLVIIDERGLNKYVRDYINEVDELTFAFGKSLVDYPEAADAITSVVLAKPFTDTYEAPDAVSLMIGFNRAFADAVGNSDGITGLTAVKLLLEELAVADEFALDLAKELEDSVTVVDNADANSGDGLEYTEVKPSSDNVGTSDTATADVQKKLADTVALAEAVRAVLEKLLADVVTASEEAKLVFGLALADAYSVADAFDRVFEAIRAFSDGASTSESLAFDSEKALADSTLATEVLSRVFTALRDVSDTQAVDDSYVLGSAKAISDSQAVDDFFARVFGANRDVADSILTSDVLASIGIEKLLTDAANAVSSGSLRMTDYADITYFAEDYVGATRTFS